MTDDLILRSKDLSLSLRPAWGGRISALRHARYGDLLVPITDTIFRPDAWPKAGGYPLVPFHNRIRDARFSFEGRDALLPVHPDAVPHALHGMSSRMAWEVVTSSPNSAALLWRRRADAVWPWPFRAEQHLELSDNTLVLTLAITNEGDVAMPAGLGWHPYFPARFTYRTDAQRHWPVDADGFPAGYSGPLPDINRPTTCYLSDWRVISLGDGSVEMTLEAQGLDHLVVHLPDAPYFCIEPVSHLAAAMHDPARPSGAEGGMHRVLPGETMTATVTLAVV